jgi:hypothetical protein
LERFQNAKAKADAAPKLGKKNKPTKALGLPSK